MELLEEEALPQKKKLDLKKEVLKYLRNWYWILLSMLLFYIGAKIYLRYTTPLYQSKTTLKFAESKAKGNTTLSDLQTLGTGLAGDNELQSETTAIISKPILTRVVKNLNLNFSYFAIGTIKEPEIYPNAPVEGKLVDEEENSFGGATYILTPINSTEYKLSEGPLKAGKNRFKFGGVADLPLGKVIFTRKSDGLKQSPIKVKIRSTASWVGQLEGSVNVSLPPNKGLLMDLSLVGAVPKKSEDILNEITKQYNIEDVKDRNEEAQNTQNFINDRLAIISDDLSGIEGQKEQFKKAHQITDLNAQASMALTNSTANTKQLVDLSTQLDVVNAVYEAASGEKLMPSNMGLSAQTEGYIQRYNDMILQKNKSLKQATTANPSIIELTREINELRGIIRQSLREKREMLGIQMAQLRGDINADQAKINNFPTQEKVFRGIERQQTLKEQLYLYLLQKREENAITLAVTTPKARVLNPAYTTGIVKPNGQQILSGALLGGLALPVLIMYGLFFLDSKVHSRNEILDRVRNPVILGEIPFQKDEDVLVKPNDFSLFAESFRMLTSNLKFILKSQQKGQYQPKTVLITSSIKGEGKTTVSMNVAVALSGVSKVLFIGADIRSPQLKRFMTPPKKGLTDFLVSEETSVENYIVPFPEHPNLHILASGAKAPNPTDLLSMEKFDEMLEAEREKYDYVVLDSAPVMLVSDTLHLVECADVVLYVVKPDLTEKDMLDKAAEFQQNNRIKKMAYVLNGVKLENLYYRKGYGYGAGYYSDHQDYRNGLQKLWDRFKV